MGCSASLIHESHELDCIDKYDVDLRQTLRLLKWNENNWDLVHNSGLNFKSRSSKMIY